MTQHVRNAEVLTSIFGTWPSFHDAELVTITLTREGPNAPILDARIHVFSATSEVDSRGFYILKNHTLATLRFSGVRSDIEIKWFNEQNVLVFLSIEPSQTGPELLRVQMPSNYGAELSFTCDAAEVISAEPFEAAAAPSSAPPN